MLWPYRRSRPGVNLHKEDGSIRAEYKYAIKVGIFSGVLLAVISTILYLFNIKTPTISVHTCIISLLVWLIVAGTGYHVVSHSREAIRRKRDAIILSAISGGLAGMINGLSQLILLLLIDIPKFFSGGLSGKDISVLALSPVGVLLVIIVASFMSVVGGVVYLARLVKIS